MATQTLAPPVRRTRPVLRLLAAVVVVVITALAGSFAWFYSAARASLPQTSGQVILRGLTAPVTVVRDAQGVPHVSAGGLEELFFAQGYVTAQDRLWQMDMTRRYAAGELAEILGPSFVESDKRQRTLLLRSSAEQAATRLSTRDRAYFEAYARGVNAYITAQKHLPIEFAVLRYHPRPWTVTDSFLVAVTMVQMLNLDRLSHELQREKVTARLSPELAADLYTNSSWRDHPPVSTPGQDEFVPAEEQPQPAEPTRRLRHSRAGDLGFRILDLASLEPLFKSQITNHKSQMEEVLAPGSNNWVISGEHTVSGRPLLSNDMHLRHQIPNVWYQAHLTSGNYDVAGVTLPGLPYVISGHNRRIAWGFTNVEPQMADLFVETFNDRGEYMTPEGWRSPEHRREVVRVRRSLLSTATRDEALDIVVTRHGPIVTALSPGETRPLALKATLFDPAAMEVPFFDIDVARNWQEFRRALSHFGTPAQNVVYADVDGHIGYQMAGMVPVRASGTGALPASGADNAHEWTGYVPFEQLPSVLDPPSGIIATANSRITPDGCAYTISNEWGPPYRTERIYRVLGSGRKFTPADMLALQMDVYSDFDRFSAQRFVYAVDHAKDVSPRGRQAAEILRNWGGQVTRDSAAPVIAAGARRELMRLVLEPKLGGAWEQYRSFRTSVWLENLLLRQPARWLPKAYASWDDLLAAALDAAVNSAEAPATLTDWRSGKQRILNIQHPLFGAIPWLRRWSDTGGVEQSGNGYTVKQVGTRLGPSERLTVDFSNLDGSTLNIVTGQSGQLFSPHYMDQWPAWQDGRTFLLPFSAAAVQNAGKEQLLLKPGN